MKLQFISRGFHIAILLCVPFAAAQAIDVDSAVTPEQLVQSYAPLHDALVTDELTKAQDATKALQVLASQWLMENSTHAQKAAIEKVVNGAGVLIATDSLDDARIAFVQISQGTISFIRADESLKAKWQLFHCPMVAKDQGYWVQPVGQDIANPFMGTMMPGCGSDKPW